MGTISSDLFLPMRYDSIAMRFDCDAIRFDDEFLLRFFASHGRQVLMLLSTVAICVLIKFKFKLS